MLLKGAPASANENGRVLRRKRLGGLLNYYHRNALDRGSILFRDTTASTATMVVGTPHRA